MDPEPPSRAVLFADSEPGTAHRTRSDPQQPREASDGEPSFSPSHPPRAVTFSEGANEAGSSGLQKTTSDPGQRTGGDGEREAYYDSRASTRREFKRRASTLGEFYNRNPNLLPQLPYTLRRGYRRWKVIGMGIVMAIDAALVPIILYYALTFGANIAEWIIFAIIATIWGGPTYVEFATRCFKLIKKEHFYRPLGTTSRWSFDSTHWVFVCAITAVTALLAAGSAPHDPWIRVLSMPGPALLLVFGGFMFAQTIWAMSGRPAPFRVSSTGKGGQLRPGVFTMVEDIVAVDGGAGRPYREAMEARYCASPRFRALMRDISLFWSIPGLLLGGACTVIVCVHSVPKSVAFGIGWGVPFVWAGIWTGITYPWVHSALVKEHVEWDAEHSKRVEPSEPSTGDKEEEREPA